MIAQTAQDRELDRKAAEAADLRLDADRGAAMLAELDRRHFEQGYTAAMFGISPDNGGLYSQAHRAGYAAFVSGHRVTFTDAAAPALLRI